MSPHDDTDASRTLDPSAGGNRSAPSPGACARIRSLREMEGEHIRHALLVFNGNKKQAAHALGISRDTLYRKIAEYGLTATHWRVHGAAEEHR